MTKYVSNVLLFIGACFIAYVAFSNINLNVFNIFKMKEGMTTSPAANGVAGGAANYSAGIKTEVIKLQDTLLISKYRSDYENVVLTLDDFVDNLMLQTTLSMDVTSPDVATQLIQLGNLNNAKTALNSVMKFIDSK